jgi:hypothetical protein
MTFQRSVIIAVCVSLGAGFLSFFLFRPVQGGGSYGGYGMLSLDQSYSDRMIGDALRSAGIETYLSESTQWVYLDDFGGLIKVPLDEFSWRLEPFDPRNDGYAEKLRSFFVRDGTRYFFIPLSPEQCDPRSGFADFLNAALGDTPHTLELLIQTQPPPRYWLLFAVFGTAVVFSFFLSDAPLLLVFLIPPCAGLVFLGSPGMVLTGTIFAFSSSLISPLRELFVRRRAGTSQAIHEGLSGGLWNRGSFVFSWVMPLLFAVFYGVLLYVGNIPVLAALFPFLSCCCVIGLVLWAQSNRDEHLRFHPVPIKEPAPSISGFFWYFKRHCPLTILPWVPAAVLALVLSLLMPEPDTAFTKPVPELGGDIPVLYAGDYEAHLAFQRSFSLRILEDTKSLKNQSESLPYSDYYRYAIGEDGLVMEAGRGEGDGQAGFGVPAFGDDKEFSPFPLADLMSFLTGYTPAVNSIHIPGDLILIVLILIPTLPSLIRGGRRERKGGSSLVVNDKRIAA